MGKCDWFCRFVSGVVILNLMLSPIFFVSVISIGSGSASDFVIALDSSPTCSPNIHVINNDWYIGNFENITIYNQTLILNGNLTINSTGKLSIYNASLILNNTISRSYNIIVNSNGSLYLSYSIVTSALAATCSKIIFYANSSGTISNSNLQNLGTNDRNFSGLIIQSDNIKLINCTIENCKYGLFLNYSSPTISNIKIANCKFGIFGIGTQSTITNCVITNSNAGVELVAGSNLTAIDSEIGTPNLNYDSKILQQNSLSIQVIFKKPNLRYVENAEILVKNNGIFKYRTKGFGGNHSKTDKDGKIEMVIVDHKLFLGNNKTDYTTTLSVKYKSRSIYNRAINLTQEHIEIIAFDNNMPVLSFPSVNPWYGTVDTNFCFKIKYSDQDADTPEKVDVETDGKIYQMQYNSIDFDWINGTWFHFNTTLSEGEHKFRFITNDDLGFLDVIVPSSKTSNLSGPLVEEQNNFPVLSEGSVTPMVGNPNTVFRYQIKYFDADCDATKISKVYIDNLGHTMTQNSTNEEGHDDNQNQALWFELDTKLPVGNHSFYFKFNDDNGSIIVRWPEENLENDAVVGPIVNSFKNHPPTIGNGSVTPKIGHRLILFSYTISYYDPDGDLPTLAMVIIDGVPYNLTRARIVQNIYFYETYLPIGEHCFYFVIGNEVNQHYVRYPANKSLVLLGPVVFDLPPVLKSGQVSPADGTTNTIFNFSILYQDSEDDLPFNGSVIIDNRPFSLKRLPINNNYNDSGHELLFSYFTPLEVGEHTYYFTFNSGDYFLRYPASGYLTGPNVIIESETQPGIYSNSSDEQSEDTIDTEDNNTSSQQPDKNNTSSDDQASNQIEGFEVINYSFIQSITWRGTEYIFILHCKIPPELIKDTICWVYINEKSYFMYINTNSKENITRLTLNILLSPDEYSYHFLFKIGETWLRYPYRGELRGPVVESEPDSSEGQEITERISNNLDLRNIQVLAIAILFLSFIIFSIYYSYFLPKKRHQ